MADEIDRSDEADAKRFRWLLDGNSEFLSDEALCYYEDPPPGDADEARRMIDEAMAEKED